MEVEGDPAPLAEGSEEQFIAEHYWGYSAQQGGGTVEYRVDHPSWRVSRAASHTVAVDFAGVYGAEFAEPLAGEPTSVFLAEGSDVTVYRGRRI